MPNILKKQRSSSIRFTSSSRHQALYEFEMIINSAYIEMRLILFYQISKVKKKSYFFWRFTIFMFGHNRFDNVT